MQPKNSRVVELFNEALTLELTIVNSYFLNARMLDNWGFPKLGKVFYDLSIDEMKDSDALINRILFFEGHPNVQRLNPITIGENAAESETILQSIIESFDAGDHGPESRDRQKRG